MVFGEIISALKDEKVRAKKEETEQERIRARADVDKHRITNQTQLETENIKFQQKKEELFSSERQQAASLSHEFDTTKLKEETRWKELDLDLEKSKQNLSLEMEKLGNEVKFKELELDQYKFNLDHQLKLKAMEHDSDKDKMLTNFMNNQTAKGVTGPTFAYNSTVANNLIKGGAMSGNDLLNNLDTFFNQQLQLNGASGGRRQIGHNNPSTEEDESEGGDGYRGAGARGNSVASSSNNF